MGKSGNCRLIEYEFILFKVTLVFHYYLVPFFKWQSSSTNKKILSLSPYCDLQQKIEKQSNLYLAMSKYMFMLILELYIESCTVVVVSKYFERENKYFQSFLSHLIYDFYDNSLNHFFLSFFSYAKRKGNNTQSYGVLLLLFQSWFANVHYV